MQTLDIQLALRLFPDVIVRRSQPPIHVIDRLARLRIDHVMKKIRPIQLDEPKIRTPNGRIVGTLLDAKQFKIVLIRHRFAELLQSFELRIGVHLHPHCQRSPTFGDSNSLALITSRSNSGIFLRFRRLCLWAYGTVAPYRLSAIRALATLFRASALNTLRFRCLCLWAYGTVAPYRLSAIRALATLFRASALNTLRFRCLCLWAYGTVAPVGREFMAIPNSRALGRP